MEFSSIMNKSTDPDRNTPEKLLYTDINGTWWNSGQSMS